MKVAVLDQTLGRLAQLIGQGRFEELETNTLEFKKVPADGQAWHECHKTL